MSSLTISEVILSPQESRPIIGRFQNGEITKEAEGRLSANICPSLDGKKKEVIIKSDSMAYKGSFNTAKQEKGSNFIAIRNRKTQKVKIIAVDFIQLLPQFPESENRSETTSKSGKELSKVFGSKKAKRLTEQAEKMLSNFENSKYELEGLMHDVLVDSGAGSGQPSEDSSTVRPPINLKAGKVSEIYNLEDIITLKELDLLEEHAKGIISGKYVEETNLCSFIQKAIAGLKDTSRRLRQVEILLYVDYLIKFFLEDVRKIMAKSFVIYPHSKIINFKILENFTVAHPSKRLRPLSMKDKLLCYIIVLSLLALNNSVELEDLSMVCNIGVKKLMTVAKAVGALPSSRGGSAISLQLPLQVDKMRPRLTPAKQKKMM